MPKLLLVLAFLGVFLWPGPTVPEQTAPHDAHTAMPDDERRLRRMLERYDAGDMGAAVAELAASPRGWARRALEEALRRIDEEIRYHRRAENRLGPTRDEEVLRGLRAGRLRMLLTAAALHLDASRVTADVDFVGSHILDGEHAVDRLLALRRDFEEHGPVSWPAATDERLDGRAAGNEWEVDWPAADAFVRRWYPAAVSRLQQLVELRLAPQLIARGLVRYPDHADLLLARGSLVETRVALARVDASLASEIHDSDTRRQWRTQLADAERDLDRARALEGAGGEAAVRLARVRTLQGRTENVRALLDEVVDGDGPGRLRFLALLFRGELMEREGRPREAERDYLEAVRLAPDAQTPLLALSRRALEAHRPDEARRWVALALAIDGAIGDPWREYLQGQAWRLEDRLSGLRRLERR